MEQTPKDKESPEKIFDAQRYECANCGQAITISSDQDKSRMKCCSNPNLIRIAMPLKENESENQRIQTAKEEVTKAYYDIIAFFDKWVDIPEQTKKILAIWIIGTYFHKFFSSFPYVFLNASKQSGKTRTLSIISWLQKNGNGELQNNSSEPVLFRTAQERGLIFDEFESIKTKEKQTLREYLNACYKEGGVVYRIEKGRKDGKEIMIPIGHKLFTPVAMANINGLDDVLADRSICLILEKSNDMSKVKKMENFKENLEIQQIKRTLDQFSVELCRPSLVYSLKKCVAGWNDYVDQKYADTMHTSTYIHNIHNIHIYTQDNTPNIVLDEIYNKIDETGIFGRNLELFFPLMITGWILNEEIFNDILKIVVELNETKREDEFNESVEVSLIEFVSCADRYRFEMQYVGNLLREFKEFLGTRGQEEDKELTVVWMGLALKKLGLISNKKRVAKGQMVLLNVDKAKSKIKIYANPKEMEERIK